MAWFWRTDDSPGDPDEVRARGFDDPFETQAAAEAWLTGEYTALAEAGVRSVSLYEADRLVYGPMSLDPE